MVNNLEEWNSFTKWHIQRFCDNRARGMVTHDTLEFPIMWDRSVPVLEHLFYIFKYYLEEVKEYANKYHVDGNIVDIEKIKEICNIVLTAYNQAAHWKTESAIYKLKKNNIIKDVLLRCIDEIEFQTHLYRLRSDKDNLIGKSDFMHVPFDSLYLCSSMRFSLPGEPCMYLGYSEEVCRIEMDKYSGGSMGHFQTKKPFQVIDLTLDCQENSEANLFELWPILAACYVTPDRTGNFKEEYIFPQVIMQYIKKEFSRIDGIQYYTCRKPDLNTSCKEYQNVALFAKQRKYNENGKEIVKDKEYTASVDISKDYPFHISSQFDMVLWNKLEFIPK